MARRMPDRRIFARTEPARRTISGPFSSAPTPEEAMSGKFNDRQQNMRRIDAVVWRGKRNSKPSKTRRATIVSASVG